jgi:hypothetical protein
VSSFVLNWTVAETKGCSLSVLSPYGCNSAVVHHPITFMTISCYCSHYGCNSPVVHHPITFMTISCYCASHFTESRSSTNRSLGLDHLERHDSFHWGFGRGLLVVRRSGRSCLAASRHPCPERVGPTRKGGRD